MPKRDKALAAFGRNVAEFRTERGLSQDKLAEEASLDRTNVSGIERGVRNPGIEVVIRLARGLSGGSTNEDMSTVNTRTKHDILGAGLLLSRL